MNKKLLIIIAILFLMVGCGKKESATEEIKSGKVTCAQMKTIMKGENNPVLIDVRTAEEYAEGHLDGAINIPYDVIVSPGVTAIEGINTATPIVVYCKSGNRSGQAYNSLKVAGYTNVYDMGAMSNCK